MNREILEEAFMSCKVLSRTVYVALTLALTAGVGALAQDLRPVVFKGVLNDFTPSTVSGGPYEMRGEWSLNLQSSGAANFTASLTMETSDYGISDATAVDPTNPSTRNPHTHYITMTNGTISYNTSVCPANSPATTASGVVVTGNVNITANGNPAPFESNGSSTIQICIIGGSQVEYTNLTVVFTGPATSHFGTQPIHGVVSKVSAN
jgi:hypothetical protein